MNQVFVCLVGNIAIKKEVQNQSPQLLIYEVIISIERLQSKYIFNFKLIIIAGN